jgi:hypothetical protein
LREPRPIGVRIDVPVPLVESDQLVDKKQIERDWQLRSPPARSPKHSADGAPNGSPKAGG